jgi:2-polyprenyl-3-methyl-5-hydroxy-6-metoxy-1,4-benzoquinol methylase
LIEKIAMEHILCDLCGQDNYSIKYLKPDTYLWLNRFEYSIVKCKTCGLTYVNPRPTQESIAYFYPNNYYIGRDSSKQQDRYKKQIKFLPTLNNENILDIGCAKGDFLISLKKKYPAISVTGVDYFSDGVNSDEIVFIKKLLFDAELTHNYFHLITAWAVFEHLHEPMLYFQEVSKLLKSSGVFVFLVTNSNSLYGKLAYREDIPRHTYHFSEKTLMQYAEKTGLILEEVIYDDAIFDGRGCGTIKNFVRKLFSLSIEDVFHTKLNYIQRIVLKFGSLMDKIIFSAHWERKIRKSGIIIVKMRKKELFRIRKRSQKING